MKQENMELEGTVLQELGNSMFKVETKHSVLLCTISGKIRKNFIRIMVGDKVKIEVSPYDLSRGRIITRLTVTKPRVNNNNTNNKNKKS